MQLEISSQCAVLVLVNCVNLLSLKACDVYKYWRYSFSLMDILFEEEMAPHIGEKNKQKQTNQEAASQLLMRVKWSS